MSAPLLEARALTLRFGHITALDDVSLALWPGEVVAIVGESGSGKTTLLRVLSGAYPPSEGSVDINGRISPMLDPVLGKSLVVYADKPATTPRSAAGAGTSRGEQTAAAR